MSNDYFNAQKTSVDKTGEDAQMLRELYNLSRSYTDTNRKPFWEKSYKAYNLVRYNVGYGNRYKSDGTVNNSKKETMESDERTVLGRSLIDSITSVLSSVEPEMNYIPTGKDQDERLIKQLNDYKSSTLEKNHFVFKQQNAFKESSIFGLHYLYEEWDPIDDCLKYYEIPQQDMIIDPNCSIDKMDEAAYMGHSYYTTVAKLRNTTYRNEDGEIVNKYKESDLEEIVRYSSAKTQSPKLAEELRAEILCSMPWAEKSSMSKDKLDKLIGETVKVSVIYTHEYTYETANLTSVIFKNKNPWKGEAREDELDVVTIEYPNSPNSPEVSKKKKKVDVKEIRVCYPYIPYFGDVQGNTLLGTRGVLEPVLNHIEEYNDYLNLWGDLTKKHSAPMIIVDPISAEAFEDFSNEAGAILWANPNNISIQRPVPVPNDIKEILRFKESEMERVTGANSIIQGSFQTGGRKTASEVDLASQLGTQRLQMRVRTLESFTYYRMADHLIKAVKLFMKGNGPECDGVTLKDAITALELTGGFDIKVDLTSKLRRVLGDLANQAQTLFNFLTNLGIAKPEEIAEQFSDKMFPDLGIDMRRILRNQAEQREATNQNIIDQATLARLSGGQGQSQQPARPVGRPPKPVAQYTPEQLAALAEQQAGKELGNQLFTDGVTNAQGN